MPEVIFSHERVGKLVVETGMDEIAWGYVLNTATFPTYGGEVVQILSTYIDNMTIQGTVSTYEKAEEVYEFFGKYFVIATQGHSPNAANKFEQTPMTLQYPQRNWTFYIQPLAAPSFVYSLETVAPRWQIEAHVVDYTLLENELREVVGNIAKEELKKFGSLSLSGQINPSSHSADPETNPFIAPNVPGYHNASGEAEFKPRKESEVKEGLGRIADYYHKLLPKYMDGDIFATLTESIGSRPIYGRQTEPNEAPEELIKEVTARAGEHKPAPKTK